MDESISNSYSFYPLASCSNSIGYFDCTCNSTYSGNGAIVVVIYSSK